jgi:hypothetical protein
MFIVMKGFKDNILFILYMDLQYLLERINEAESREEAEEYTGAVFNLFQEMNDMIEELKQSNNILQCEVDDLNCRVEELENQ